MTAIKICGLSRAQDIVAVNQALPDYVGFVLAPSSRQVTPQVAAELSQQLDSRITAVGVFVDAQPALIRKIHDTGTIKMAQLHGSSADSVANTARQLRESCDIAIICALPVTSASWRQQARALLPVCDCLLLDGARPGSGQVFDWQLLASDLPQLAKPCWLAGGIRLANIDQALALRPAVIDVSSGAEVDGKKDAAKITALVQRVRAAQTTDREGEKEQPNE